MRALILVAALLSSGCFVELRAGLSMVTGGNDPSWRPAPMMGVSAGFALDVGAGRFAVGAGADAVSTTLLGKDHVALAGPTDMRFDVRLVDITKVAPGAMLPGIAFAGTFPSADGRTRGRYTQNGDVWEGRKYGMGTTFAGLALNKYVGSIEGPIFFDAAIGPVVPLAAGSPGTTNLWGLGGEVRLRLSHPFLRADALAATEAIEGAAARTRRIEQYKHDHPPPSQLDASVRRIEAQRQYDACVAAAQQELAARRLDDPTPAPVRTCSNRAADAEFERAQQEGDLGLQRAIGTQ